MNVDLVLTDFRQGEGANPVAAKFRNRTSKFTPATKAHTLLCVSTYIYNPLAHPAIIAARTVFFERLVETCQVLGYVRDNWVEEWFATMNVFVVRSTAAGCDPAGIADAIHRCSSSNFFQPPSPAAFSLHWASETHPHVPLAQYIAPICAWADDWLPLEVLLKPYSRFCIDEKQHTLIEDGEVYLAEQALKTRKENVHAKVHRQFFGGNV